MLYGLPLFFLFFSFSFFLQQQCGRGGECASCDTFHRQAQHVASGWITFASVAGWMHDHMPEVQRVTPTAHHCANVNLCRHLPERRWDQLPARNPNFVGHGELLAQMDDRCFGGSHSGSGSGLVSLVLTNALTGSGGVGKSQSANEFAHRNLQVNDLDKTSRA